MRFRLVDRQFQPPHHVAHRRQGVIRPATTQDHEVVGIVDDPGLITGLMPEGLPTQHETSHVQIRQQG